MTAGSACRLSLQSYGSALCQLSCHSQARPRTRPEHLYLAGPGLALQPTCGRPAPPTCLQVYLADLALWKPPHALVPAEYTTA